MSNPNWNDPLVQYGIGAFETMRAVHGTIPLWPWHRQRLERALEYWNQARTPMEKPLELVDKELQKPLEFVEKKLQNLLEQQQEQPTSKIKLLLGLGEKGWIHHFYNEAFEPELKAKKLLICESLKPTAQSFKSCNYAEHWLAFKKAQSQACDDVIYLSSERTLLECSTACLISEQSPERFSIVKNDTLASVSAQCLVERFPDHFNFCPELSLKEALQKPLFTCNALRGLQPVAQIRAEAGKQHELPCFEKTAQFWNEQLFRPAPDQPAP